LALLLFSGLDWPVVYREIPGGLVALWAGGGPLGVRQIYDLRNEKAKKVVRFTDAGERGLEITVLVAAPEIFDDQVTGQVMCYYDQVIYFSGNFFYRSFFPSVS